MIKQSYYSGFFSMIRSSLLFFLLMGTYSNAAPTATYAHANGVQPVFLHPAVVIHDVLDHELPIAYSA